MSKLTAGQPFPNFTVDTLYGGTQQIDAMLGAGKTVFWCLRYIGCTVCRYDIHLMAQRYAEVQAKGAKDVGVEFYWSRYKIHLTLTSVT